jgi:DNA-binding transcriptional LysR family regulator
VGVALLADFLVANDKERAQLKRLLPEYAQPPLHIYACYPSRKHAPLKTRVFVDYLAAALKSGLVKRT